MKRNSATARSILQCEGNLREGEREGRREKRREETSYTSNR